MTKQIVCPVCNGYGFVSVCGENSIGAYTCDHCNGAGEIEVPMTNADRIRVMSDEELVGLFGHNSICDYVQDHSSEHCEKQGSCDKCLVKWLQQPVAE